MSKVEEIEQAAAQLPLKDLAELARRIEKRCRHLEGPSSPAISRDHSAFLGGYAAEDEGLYDDATSG